MFQMPYHRESILFRESYSDASVLQKNISHLGQQKSLRNMGGSADNLASTSPRGSVTSVNSDGGIRTNKDRLAAFKKSHISHSTGDLLVNSRVNLSLFGDVQTNDSQFFEVMYIGKIKVSHKKVPKTFIDDAIPKFKAHDELKMKNLEMAAKEAENVHQNLSDTSVVQGDLKIILSKDSDEASGSDTSGDNQEHKSTTRTDSIQVQIPKRNRSASIGAVPIIEQNRTMVFLLGRNDIRLISPDRKQILLHKDFKDVMNCVEGSQNPDHFGIISYETKDNKCEYIGYVFKCQSASISHDITSSVTKSIEAIALAAEEAQEKIHMAELLTCEHCPMIWYNKLCAAIDGLNDKKTFSTIVRYTETLSDEDQESIMQKFYGPEKVHDMTIKDKAEFLLALIEAHCQHRQQRHVHDTPENRSEFLNQYLGGSTIFMKAKRSLTSSFDHLLRRTSKDFVDGNNNFSHIPEHTEEPSNFKSKSRSMSIAPNMPQTQTFKNDDLIELEPTPTTTSKMDIFLKVGNTTKEKGNKNSASWRQEIMKHVADDESKMTEGSINLLPVKSRKQTRPHVKRTTEQLRELWKTGGKQIILLLRMEKENARLQERQNEHEIRRIKLEYDEIMACDSQLGQVWDNYINQASTAPHIDNRLFLQAIKSGVPRGKRGDVWKMLAEQHNKNHPPIDVSSFPNFNTTYQDLLRNLTEHQHAIFLDIGRTFPAHEFYKAPFGLGQLSLFNILKAYSIIDPELGYCQGLAFICGILLLHLDEQDAFSLLKHLMFKRQMRLNYLPDMKQFQMQLYQLSRLIKDHLPDLYSLFDKNDVAPTLYASPWILTIFSSGFPLGFVARVFDLLFFSSDEIIFRVILSLLQVHKDELMNLDCFEDIMDYLRNVVPNINDVTMSKVFKNVYCLNITRQLMDYKIEYNVLKEEIRNTNQHLDNLNIEKRENKTLQKQLQMAESNIERLENIRHNQQQELQSMQMQVQSLEVTISSLGDYLTSLSIHRTDIDIPTDIRRLLQQLEYQHNQQRQQQMKKRPIFQENRKLGKSISVNSNMGMGLKVLLEQNEIDHSLPPVNLNPPIPPATSPDQQPARKKFFENTYEQIRQKSGSFKNKSWADRDKSVNSPPTIVEQVILDPPIVEQVLLVPTVKQEILKPTAKQEILKPSVIETEKSPVPMSAHPLSCDDVNFQFNTMQLKSIKTTKVFKKQ